MPVRSTSGSSTVVAAPVTYRHSSPRIQWRRPLRPVGVERLLLAVSESRRGLEALRQEVPHEELLADLASTQLVFAVTAGRTGTTFLTTLLAAVEGVDSHHEPRPEFEAFLRRVQKDPAAARTFWLDYKLPAIRDRRTGVYVELSNVFGKGFLEPLLELGLVPDLLVLRRAPRAVARSYLERYTVPGRTKLGLEYLLSPADPGVLPLPGWRGFSDYQLCFWYALEMERRQRDLPALVLQRGGSVVDTSAERLNRWEGFVDLLEGLGLGDRLPNPDLEALHAEITSTAHNLNPRRAVIEGDLAAEEEVVWEVVGRADPGLRDHVESSYRP